MSRKKIYDGKQFCHKDDCCPQVFQEGKNVIISDPDKPENGEIKMSVTNYNNLLKNAQSVKD